MRLKDRIQLFVVYQGLLTLIVGILTSSAVQGVLDLPHRNQDGVGWYVLIISSLVFWSGLGAGVYITKHPDMFKKS